MKMLLDQHIAANYHSPSQRIRVISESWVEARAYCPNCGKTLARFENNRPAADFLCSICSEEFELKSKGGSFAAKIPDGAYESLMERLQSDNNPNLFLMTYNKLTLSVNDFFVIPKHFFTPGIIEKRKPLAATARRAGWIGCNISLRNIPQFGKIFFVKNGLEETKNNVLTNWSKTLFLREQEAQAVKGWILDVIYCIDRLGKQDFTLQEIYAYENLLAARHPSNKHIKAKIRQQLQFLREKGYLNFGQRGAYHLNR